MTTSLRRLPDAAAGLALERSLFESDQIACCAWEAQTPGLVCPRRFETWAGFAGAADAASKNGWPVHLRPTGGGTVPQGPGIANVALAFNALPGTTVEDGYRLLTDILKRGLGAETLKAGDTPGSFCDGAWNLSHRGQKIVGTAQRWRPKPDGRPRVLAHAVLLVRNTFRDGARAVARFHDDLGLGSILVETHTSLEAAFGITELPSDAILRVAQDTLENL